MAITNPDKILNTLGAHRPEDNLSPLVAHWDSAVRSIKGLVGSNPATNQPFDYSAAFAEVIPQVVHKAAATIEGHREASFGIDLSDYPGVPMDKDGHGMPYVAAPFLHAVRNTLELILRSKDWKIVRGTDCLVSEDRKPHGNRSTLHISVQTN